GPADPRAQPLPQATPLDGQKADHAVAAHEPDHQGLARQRVDRDALRPHRQGGTPAGLPELEEGIEHRMPEGEALHRLGKTLLEARHAEPRARPDRGLRPAPRGRGGEQQGREQERAGNKLGHGCLPGGAAVPTSRIGRFGFGGTRQRSPAAPDPARQGAGPDHRGCGRFRRYEPNPAMPVTSTTPPALAATMSTPDCTVPPMPALAKMKSPSRSIDAASLKYPPAPMSCAVSAVL